MTPKEYVVIKKIIAESIDELRRLDQSFYADACKSPRPALRPAVASDIVIGAVIWYDDFDADVDCDWVIVEEVLAPADLFKAFVCKGSRYGLMGALVEL